MLTSVLIGTEAKKFEYLYIINFVYLLSAQGRENSLHSQRHCSLLWKFPKINKNLSLNITISKQYGVYFRIVDNWIVEKCSINQNRSLCQHYKQGKALHWAMEFGRKDTAIPESAKIGRWGHKNCLKKYWFCDKTWIKADSIGSYWNSSRAWD